MEARQQPIRLQAGQSFTALVAQGTHVVALDGAVFIEPAGAQLLPCPTILREGEAWLAGSSGWLAVSAPLGGQFLLAPPLPAEASWHVRLRSHLSSALSGALRLLRRRAPAG